MTTHWYRFASRSHLAFNRRSRFIAVAIASLCAELTTVPAAADVIAFDDVIAVTPLLTIGNTAAGSLTANDGSFLSGAIGFPPVPTPFTQVIAGATASGNGSISVTGAGSQLS